MSMNLTEAFNFLKNNPNAVDMLENSLSGAAYTPGDKRGDFHLFSLSYDNSEENDDGTRDCFTLYISAGDVFIDQGKDYRIQATTIEGILEEFEDYKLTDVVSGVKFSIYPIDSVEGYLIEYALKKMFDGLPYVESVAPKEIESFKNQAIAFLQ